jgi:hypothetical protein
MFNLDGGILGYLKGLRVKFNPYISRITPKPLPMIFEELYNENRNEMTEAVKSVSSFLKVKPDHLQFLMWFETGRTLDHRIVNFQKGDSPDPAVRCFKRATGLIQFMPSTSILLGTTNSKLRQMQNFEQMEYVKRHLGIFRGKYIDYVDLYCGIFWPAAVGKPDSYRITSDMVAKQNPIFDINKDLDIEKSEIRTALRRQIPEKYKALFS